VVIAAMYFVERKDATMCYCLHNEMSGDIISLYYFASFLGGKMLVHKGKFPYSISVVLKNSWPYNDDCQ
jgi:hypothetical protein